MRTLARRLCIAVLSFALISFAFACQGENTDGDVAPADSMAAATEADHPADGAVSSGLEAGVSSTYDVAITNPMPHAMSVTIEYTGGGETELGTVPAGGAQSFTLAASAGETVTLVASDEAGTHSPSTTITLPLGQTQTAWAIE